MAAIALGVIENRPAVPACWIAVEGVLVSNAVCASETMRVVHHRAYQWPKIRPSTQESPRMGIA